MIQVTVYKDDYINRLKIEGHSGYKSSGSDIVCSAVSTACTVSFNLVDKVCSNYIFTSNPDIPIMDFVVNEFNEFVEIILKNLVDTLNGISCEYKKYLKIKNE